MFRFWKKAKRLLGGLFAGTRVGEMAQAAALYNALRDSNLQVARLQRVGGTDEFVVLVKPADKPVQMPTPGLSTFAKFSGIAPSKVAILEPAEEGSALVVRDETSASLMHLLAQRGIRANDCAVLDTDGYNGLWMTVSLPIN